LTAFQCIRIHRGENDYAANQSIRIRISTEIGKPVADHLENEHPRQDTEEDGTAPPEQTDPANNDSSQRSKFPPASEERTYGAVLYRRKDPAEANRDSVQSFESALLDIPEIIQAQRLFGDPDYMLHVVARELNAFQALYDRSLSALPSVLRLTSTLVMKSIVQNRPLPL
jgi:DNA-binding Lrp family transcriptional regulator